MKVLMLRKFSLVFFLCLFSVLMLYQNCDFFVGTAGAEETACSSRRKAAFDIGSGSLKVAIQETLTCVGKSPVVRAVNLPAEIKNSPLVLEKSKVFLLSGSGATGPVRGQIPSQEITRLIEKIRELKTTLEAQYSVSEFTAVATHAIREASNRAEIELQFRQKVSGVPLMVLSQDQEGQLGLAGALLRAETLPSDCDKAGILAWDIGGGSIQFIRKSPAGEAHLNLQTGAEAYRHKVLAHLAALSEPRPEKCSPEFGDSPNPIGQTNLPEAERLAMATFTPSQVVSLKKWVEEVGPQCVIGIGGVHAKAVFENLNRKRDRIVDCQSRFANNNSSSGIYTLEQVQCAAQVLSEKTDCDPLLKSPFSTTDVTNLLFVQGMMKQLGLTAIRALDVNMTDAILVSKQFWERTAASNPAGPTTRQPNSVKKSGARGVSP